MRYQNKGPFGIQDNYKNNILEAANQSFLMNKAKQKLKLYMNILMTALQGSFIISWAIMLILQLKR